MRFVTFLVLSSAAVVAPTVSATVTEYTNKSSWQNAVSNNYTTITFSELPQFTQVTAQYSYLGVMFTDPSGDFIIQDPGFLNDGWGLYGNLTGTIDMSFSQPMNWIGVNFPGRLDIQLFSGGQMVYAGHGPSGFGGGGVGWFAGLVSSQPFDAARLLPTGGGSVNIDDLYFGPPIPGPGALGVFPVAAALVKRRRRCGRLN